MKTKNKIHCMILAVGIFYLSAPVYGQTGIQKIQKILKMPTKPTVESPTTKPDGNNGNVASTTPQKKSNLIPGHLDLSATTPMVDKTSLVFHLRSVEAGYLNDSPNHPLPWVWYPLPYFTVYGPIDAGNIINVAYTLPNGTAWFNHDCGGPFGSKLDPGIPADIECSRDNIPKGKPTTQTGVFGFKITLRNELAGTTTELYSGKVKIESWSYNPTNQPKFAKQFIYYPNLDWKLPLALLYTPAPKDQYDNLGPLTALMWFRGKKYSASEVSTVGYLYYQGQQVAATNAMGTNNVSPMFTEEQPEESENEYQGRVFRFNAFLYDKNGSGMKTFFPVYKNPGDYEIKVLQNGKLSRSVKFSVDAGGNLVNNGINSQNKLGTTKILVPAQIIGEQDGKWNKTAWQTEGFFGTPLIGFTAP